VTSLDPARHDRTLFLEIHTMPAAWCPWDLTSVPPTKSEPRQGLVSRKIPPVGLNAFSVYKFDIRLKRERGIG
jgi:hypothetical protein